METSDIDIACTVDGQKISGVAWMNSVMSRYDAEECRTSLDHLHEKRESGIYQVPLKFSVVVGRSPQRIFGSRY